jgi:DNA-binding winged helix-turn-helix (wHTH) protein
MRSTLSNLDRNLMRDSMSLAGELSLDAQGFPCWQGVALPLPPKERAVLGLLIRHRPAVVDKERFASEVWNGACMSDESLARCISRIRRCLNEVAGLALRVESVYGQGYRLAGALAAPRASHRRLQRVAQAAPGVAEAYLHARQLAQRRTPLALQQAMDLLRKLVASEPDYAPARIALCEVMAGAASWGMIVGASFVEEGLHHLRQAAECDPDAPGLDAARAHLLDLGWRFEDAEVSYRLALQRQPDDPETQFLYGWHHLVTGHNERAIEQLRLAQTLQPYSPLVGVTVSRACAHAGRLQEALGEAQATCLVHPDSVIAASYRLALQAHLAPEAALVEQAWRWVERHDAPAFALGVLGYVMACCGRPDEALDVVQTSLACAGTNACSALLHVATLAGLGRHEQATSLLVRACEARCALLPMVLRDPANAWVSEHPRAAEVKARVFAGLGGG